ncbi:hypothetical protein SB778_21140 [Paraburkholderia sp. SIMBA_050]
MNLAAFSVTNYRSITGTSKFPVGDFAVTIGKNSEGKSNVLRALAASMKILTTLTVYPKLAFDRETRISILGEEIFRSLYSLESESSIRGFVLNFR